MITTLQRCSLVFAILLGCGDDDGPEDGGRMDVGLDAPDASDATEPDAPLDVGRDAPEEDGGDVDAGPNPASAQIAAVRAADGLLDPALPVSGAIVTYLLAQLGSDPAGFFVQGDRTGPALFVAVDPATLDPAPAVGDVVAFDVTETLRVRRQHRVVGITEFARLDSGFDVSSLVQNLTTTADLLSNLREYESELVLVQGTLSTEGTFGGSGHTRFKFRTDAIDSDRVAFRAPNPLIDAIEVGIGCSLTAGPAPLWRTDDRALVSAFRDEEVTERECPPPTLRRASAPGATSVRLRFSRPIDPASVDAADIVFSGGGTPLAVIGFVVDQRFVDVETTPQTRGITYTVTVTGVRGSRGMLIDPAMNSASFAGSGPTSAPGVGSLVITEIFYDDGVVGTDDGLEWIEVFNPSATTTFQLLGCELDDVVGDSDPLPIIDSVRVEPRARIVFGGPQSETTSAFEWGPSLDESGDQVTLRCEEGVVVDTVDFGVAGFVRATRRSLQLDPSVTSAAGNDVGGAWCVSPDSATYGGRGFRGTPGTANAACPGG